MRRSITDAEDRILEIALGIVIIASIIGNIIRVPIQWQLPFIFVALFAIIRLLSPISAMRTEIRQLRESVRPALCIYQNEEVYAEMAKLLRESKQRVGLQYLRHVPPPAFRGSNAQRYFRAVTSWAQSSASHSVRRIVCVPNAEMLEWARQHHLETNGIKNYECRVIEWKATCDALNVGFFDHTVFLTFPGDTSQEMRGVKIEGETAYEYFSTYYNQLWNASDPLESYLASHSII